jgi:hypothetical protein
MLANPITDVLLIPCCGSPLSRIIYNNAHTWLSNSFLFLSFIFSFFFVFDKKRLTCEGEGGRGFLLNPILSVVEGSVNGVRRDEQAKTKSKRRKKKTVRRRLGQPMIFF